MTVALDLLAQLTTGWFAAIVLAACAVALTSARATLHIRCNPRGAGPFRP
ncbi:hypothetical protein ITJ44_15685 [Clavibacter sp. VKM Ac-2873]|nr:hypothetical protein [Clavibacter sp. VKM Ac-2873]MBF4619517.1 hypothetical protein [Clavibacter sp. VKM Ac-2873]